MLAVTQDQIDICKMFLESKREEIIRLQQERGVKASGLSAASLVVSETERGAVLIDGAGYFEFQDFGRGAGKPSPVQKIYDWLQYKKYGLTYENDKQRLSLAFAISRNHAKQGSRFFKKNTFILQQSLSPSTFVQLYDDLSNSFGLQVLTDIERVFND